MPSTAFVIERKQITHWDIHRSSMTDRICTARKFVRWIMLAALVLPLSVILPSGTDAQEGCPEDFKGLVRIKTSKKLKDSQIGSSNEPLPNGNGSGFVVRAKNGELFVITAAHVVDLSDTDKEKYYPVIEARTCEEDASTRRLRPLNGILEDRGDLDIAILEVVDPSAGPLAAIPFELASVPNIPDAVQITVSGYPDYERGISRPAEIVAESWNSDNVLAVLTEALAEGYSGSPIRDRRTGHVLGIAATKNIMQNQSGAILIRGEVKDLIEKYTKERIYRFNYIKESVRHVILQFIEEKTNNYSDEGGVKLAKELELISKDTDLFFSTVDTSDQIEWSFYVLGDNVTPDYQSPLISTDDFMKDNTDKTTTLLFRTMLEKMENIIRLRNILFVRIRVHTLENKLKFVPHYWYIYNSGKISSGNLDEFIYDPERYAHRTAVAKALLYLLRRIDYIPTKLNARAVCVLYSNTEFNNAHEYFLYFNNMLNFSMEMNNSNVNLKLSNDDNHLPYCLKEDKDNYDPDAVFTIRMNWAVIAATMDNGLQPAIFYVDAKPAWMGRWDMLVRHQNLESPIDQETRSCLAQEQEGMGEMNHTCGHFLMFRDKLQEYLWGSDTRY